MIDRLFLAHPRSVGESYGAHFRTAARFALLMLAGSVAAAIHALVPALCARTASGIVKDLNGEMRARTPAPAPVSRDWQLEYEI